MVVLFSTTYISVDFTHNDIYGFKVSKGDIKLNLEHLSAQKHCICLVLKGKAARHFSLFNTLSALLIISYVKIICVRYSLLYLLFIS